MPDLAIKFDEVIADELVNSLSFQVPAGSLGAIVTSRQVENDLQVRLVLGLEKFTAGSITVLGEDVGGASDKSLLSLRTRVAVVFPTGGLVSNLKVWENLVLPLQYHALYPPAEIEERGMAMLRAVRYKGALMELPGHLSLYEKRLIGLARAMLTNPELIIYNAILDGLSIGEKNALITAALSFHREKAGRTSLFLTPNPETVKEIPLDSCVLIKGSPSHG
jgi:ABC-type transporter Mla maintaining outer membrane lipid asymmetry ATPase subunit MlaF